MVQPYYHPICSLHDLGGAYVSLNRVMCFLQCLILSIRLTQRRWVGRLQLAYARSCHRAPLGAHMARKRVTGQDTESDTALATQYYGNGENNQNGPRRCLKAEMSQSECMLCKKASGFISTEKWAGTCQTIARPG